MRTLIVRSNDIFQQSFDRKSRRVASLHHNAAASLRHNAAASLLAREVDRAKDEAILIIVHYSLAEHYERFGGWIGSGTSSIISRLIGKQHLQLCIYYLLWYLTITQYRFNFRTLIIHTNAYSLFAISLAWNWSRERQSLFAILNAFYYVLYEIFRYRALICSNFFSIATWWSMRCMWLILGLSYKVWWADCAVF